MSLDLWTAIETVLAALVYVIGGGLVAIFAKSILDALLDRNRDDGEVG